MQLLSNWARQWLVTFNPLKTEAVLFTLKKINILPHFIFDNIPINFVDSHNHLGVTFSSTGQWHSHIENIVLSATKILGIIWKLKYSLIRNGLNQIYMSFLLPIVEYVSFVWDGCSKQDTQTLQKIQNEAARLVTGLTKSVSLENLFKECGLTTLLKRRQQHKLSFMYKVNNGIVPSYIHDLIPPLVSEISNYPMRNNRNISVPFNRTSISQKSCIPSCISLWNSIEDDLKKIYQHYKLLKKHITLRFNNSCVPSHFTIGNRHISILHARLRKNCSNLNNDLFGNHNRENPLCDLCGMVKDAIHYFFHCRKFTIKRQVFNDTVRDFQLLSIDMILCGNYNLNMENNIVLIRTVHRYIHATKRFKPSWLFVWSFSWNIFCILTLSLPASQKTIPQCQACFKDSWILRVYGFNTEYLQNHSTYWCETLTECC